MSVGRLAAAVAGPTAPAGYRTMIVVGAVKKGEPALWDVIPTER